MSAAVEAAPAPPPASFWKRRVVAPIVNQLRQGITPERIALTIALGLLLSIFPILGATTLLCGLAALLLRLNQPIIQLINYLAYPLQLLLLIPFYRAGETLFRQPHIPLSIPLFLERIRIDFWLFLRDFGMIAMQGIVVWSLVAPLATTAIYFAIRPPLRALARKLAA
jgi:uncharacterized protein (DUF2062 family)